MDDGLMPLWTRAARADEIAEVQAIDARLAEQLDELELRAIFKFQPRLNKT